MTSTPDPMDWERQGKMTFPVAASVSVIASAGQASAAAISSSLMPSPITTAVSPRANTPGAMSTQSPWPLQAPSSMVGYEGHVTASLVGVSSGG